MRGVLGLVMLAACGRVAFDTRNDATTADADALFACGTVPIANAAAGRDFTCALRTDGSVACWGVNFAGQLGSPGPTSVAPIEVSLPARATAIDAGAYHACAVLEDGRAYCWGQNQIGQLGDGTTTARTGPVQVTNLPGGVDEIATGSNHSCARVASDGRVYCWGQNSRNQLGDGATANRATPGPVSNLVGMHGLTAGHAFSCAIASDSTAVCWGYNPDAQLGNGTLSAQSIPVAPTSLSNVSEIATGGRFACARRTDGSVACWGSNSTGQYGVGTTVSRNMPFDTGASAALLAAGVRHQCIASAAGVSCSGSNAQGQLGDGTQQIRHSSAPIAIDIGRPSVLDSSYNHTCAVVGGTVWCWGSNQAGQLGAGIRSAEPTAVEVAEPLAASGVFVADNFSCATVNGAARCWGSLPLGPGATGPSTTALGSAVLLAGGSQHLCAITPIGTVQCFGQNYEGQLGSGTFTGNEPTPLTMTGVSPATSLSAGGFVTCAVTNGAVRCTGRNDRGQLGDGSMVNRETAIDAGNFTNATQVSTSGQSTCARLASGEVWCWGANTRGLIGDGMGGTSRPTPSRVIASGFGTAEEVSVGLTHACLRNTTGEVWCWGSNTAGQFGDGSEISQGTPTRAGFTGATHIAVGGDHTCALAGDGRVWCAGSNHMGQLGDGTYESRVVPVQAILPEPATAIGAGSFYSCALLASGRMRCWGNNRYGNLGTGEPLLGATPQLARVYCP